MDDVRYRLMMDDMRYRVMVHGLELLHPAVVAGRGNRFRVACTAGTCICHDACRTAGRSLGHFAGVAVLVGRLCRGCGRERSG